MKETKGLTLTIVTPEILPLNYGEKLGNIMTLKTISLPNGSKIVYASNKAIKYEIRHQGEERFGWKLLDRLLEELIANRTKNNILNVDEFAKDLIKNYEEFDLFGGMFPSIVLNGKKISFSEGYEKTGIKRETPTKIGYAFSLSEYQEDTELNTNLDSYRRYLQYITDEKQEQALFFSENFRSNYVYTISIDLDRIGIWENYERKKINVIPNSVKTKRIIELLEIVKTLYRNIKGRKENLSPIFVIGGVFSVKNAFFEGKVKASLKDKKLSLNIEAIKSAIELIPEEERNNVICGIANGFFENEKEIKKELEAITIGEFFKTIENQVREYYENE
jgi:CRISPR-associated protein Cst2